MRCLTSQHGVDANALMNRRKNVATLAKSKPEAPADQVQRFERKLREVKQAIANLPGDEYHEELLKIVRRAGWTTLAEGIFFEALIESMLAHTRDLAQLHHGSRLPSRPSRKNNSGAGSSGPARRALVWRHE